MSANFQLKRSPEEIRELIEECRESKTNQIPLSFEHGIRSALSWLFYESAPYPYDATPPDISKVEIDDGREYKQGEFS